jgi:hypothetical protein
MPLSPIQEEVYDAVIVDKTLLDALPKTLDAMSTTMCVLLPIAAIVIWAALTKKTFKIGDFEFELSNAFWPVLLVFVGANLILLFNLVQLGSALQRLTTASVEEGITRIWYHSWVLNPFCYFGDEATERTACLFGYGSLILAWWVCFLAVASLLNYRPSEKSKSEDNEVQEIRTITQLPLLIPITTGLGAMAAIGRVYKIIGLRGNEVHGIPIAAFQASLPTRETIGLVAIAVGLMIFVLMENRLLRQAGYATTWLLKAGSTRRRRRIVIQYAPKLVAPQGCTCRGCHSGHYSLGSFSLQPTLLVIHNHWPRHLRNFSIHKAGHWQTRVPVALRRIRERRSLLTRLPCEASVSSGRGRFSPYRLPVASRHVPCSPLNKRPEVALPQYPCAKADSAVRMDGCSQNEQ